jgi:hypothetical protein
MSYYFDLGLPFLWYLVYLLTLFDVLDGMWIMGHQDILLMT